MMLAGLSQRVDEQVEGRFTVTLHVFQQGEVYLYNISIRQVSTI